MEVLNTKSAFTLTVLLKFMLAFTVHVSFIAVVLVLNVSAFTLTVLLQFMFTFTFHVSFFAVVMVLNVSLLQGSVQWIVYAGIIFVWWLARWCNRHFCGFSSRTSEVRFFRSIFAVNFGLCVYV